MLVNFECGEDLVEAFDGAARAGGLTRSGALRVLMATFLHSAGRIEDGALPSVFSGLQAVAGAAGAAADDGENPPSFYDEVRHYDLRAIKGGGR